MFTLISGFNPTPVEMKLSKCLCWVMGPHQDNTKEMRKEQEASVKKGLSWEPAGRLRDSDPQRAGEGHSEWAKLQAVAMAGNCRSYLVPS